MRWGVLGALALFSVHAWAGASTGFTPIHELGTGLYKGQQGGLYPGGTNLPPSDHLAVAMEAAVTIVPRDANGVPSPDGLVGWMSVGMSNTVQETKVFERDADRDAQRNGRLVLVNGAVGAASSLEWRNPGDPVWDQLEARIRASGLTPEQVQVVWLKHGGGSPTSLLFPDHALALRDDLAAIVRNVKDKYPNVALTYLSSRTYGGWSTRPDHGEPLCYETGFAVKWLVEDQIEGDPSLNPIAARGPVEAPVLLWGPYLWTDGELGRDDGLVWLADDLENDGIHLRPSGEQKVADLLHRFFETEPTARAWWGQDSLTDVVTLDAVADASVESGAPSSNTGSLTYLRTSGPTNVARAYLKFDLSGIERARIRHAKLSLRTITKATGLMRSSAGTSWGEGTITWANAPAPDAGNLGAIPEWTPDGSMSHGVTSAVKGDADGIVTLVIEGVEPELVKWSSRESGEGPRLALTVTTTRITIRLEKDPASAGVKLSWNDNGAAPFLVRRALGPTPAHFDSSVDAGASGTSHVDAGALSAPQSYWYLVE